LARQSAAGGFQDRQQACFGGIQSFGQRHGNRVDARKLAFELRLGLDAADLLFAEPAFALLLHHRGQIALDAVLVALAGGVTRGMASEDAVEMRLPLRGSLRDLRLRGGIELLEVLEVVLLRGVAFRPHLARDGLAPAGKVSRRVTQSVV